MAGNPDGDTEGDGGEDPSVEPGDGNGVTEADASGWVAQDWHKSRRAQVLVLADVLLIVVVSFGMVEISDDSVAILQGNPPTLDAGPLTAILAAVLGATAYVFTSLATDFDRRAGKILQMNLRIPAAIPIGLGVFLLSDFLLGDVGVGILVSLFSPDST